MGRITITDASDDSIQLTELRSSEDLSRKIAQYQELFEIGVKYVDIFVWGWLFDTSYNTTQIEMNHAVRIVSVPYKQEHVIVLMHDGTQRKIIIGDGMPVVVRLSLNVEGHDHWRLYRNREPEAT